MLLISFEIKSVFSIFQIFQILEDNILLNFLKNLSNILHVIDSEEIFLNCSISRKLFSIRKVFNSSIISSNP